MGSCGMLLRQGGRSLFYTGDVNFEAQTIVREADFPREKVDALIVETTRGDYARPGDFSRRAEKERLAALIRETHERGGSVLIPVFALGKSQELLVTLHELRGLNLIPDMPVIIGGLSTKITLVYDQYASRVRRSYEGFRIMEDMRSLVAPRKRRAEINLAARTIYALSSGMMTEGTLSNEFARRFVTHPNNAVAFVGYTDHKTPGWRLRQAKPGDLVHLDEKKPPVEVRSRIESFDFSAHASRESIVDYVRAVQPSKVLLVHGDAPAMDWFARRFSADLPGSEVILPEPGHEITLW
jgi:Cft2 family RNA processing exonuclease